MQQCVFFPGLCVCVCLFVFCESQFIPAPVSHQLSHSKVSQYLGSSLRHHSYLWNGAYFSSQWGTDCRSRYHYSDKYLKSSQYLGSSSGHHRYLLGHHPCAPTVGAPLTLVLALHWVHRLTHTIWPRHCPSQFFPNSDSDISDLLYLLGLMHGTKVKSELLANETTANELPFCF